MLNREEIRDLIIKNKLIENYINLDIQLTPNGFDLTVGNIFKFNKTGRIDFSNSERLIPELEEIQPVKKHDTDKFGWWILEKGAYKIRTNEIINLPNNLVALCFSRTSLLRIGAFCQHGVWDAGFSGKGEFILVVENYKIELKQNARVAQLIFLKINETIEYNGIYKNL